ncbi:MAG: histidine phosphatase family protein [Candidatus Eremiobacteraeota bacterium]|nr:histidine phosphatase family protein [Candidatus Eremiobacteraeota bacterium]
MRILLIPVTEREKFQDLIISEKLDSSLSKKGVEDARRIGKFLRNKVRIDKIYSGSSIQSKETAQSIGAILNVKPSVIEEFREIDMGDFEGQSRDTFKRSDEGRIFFYEMDKCIISGAKETIPEAQKRAMEKVKEITKHYNDEASIAIISHRGILACILCGLLDISLAKSWNFKLGRPAIASLKSRDYGTFELLELINDELAKINA